MAKYEVDDLLWTIDTAHKRLEEKDALFQEALKHLEVALGNKCECEYWISESHADHCPYAAAERFLEEHRKG